MLNGVTIRGTAAAVARAIPGRMLGGKTGTTNEFRSAWFVGFSPQIVVATYVGFDDNHTLGHGETGAILFGQKPEAHAHPMRRLVELGPAAVPHLLDHLTDARRTKLVIVRSGVGGLNVQADEEPAKGSGDSPGNWYTVKVAGG